MSKNRSVKIALLGAYTCGKSSLVTHLRDGVFPPGPLPDHLDSFNKLITVEASPISLDVWDLSWGPNPAETMMMCSFPETDVYVLCFSIADRDSMRLARCQFFPMIEQAISGSSSIVPDSEVSFPFVIEQPCPFASTTPNAILIVAGLKSDLRTGEDGNECISAQEGKEFADELGAVSYVECSAMTDPESVQVFFEAVAQVGLGSVEGKKKKCLLQ